jgi:hypothetical protein
MACIVRGRFFRHSDIVAPHDSWLARLLLALAVSTACKGTPAEQSSPLDSVFGLTTIAPVDIHLSADALQALRDEPKKWTRGAVTLMGQHIKDVAVRLKGHRSMRPIDGKPAFKLRFDKYVAGRRIFGTSTLVLNNMVEDPTMMREFLGYRLYNAAGVAAPRVGYATLAVNGEARGLYAVIEAVDEQFLRRLGSTAGTLYEGEYGCDLYPDDVEGFDRDFGNGDRNELRALAETASRGIPELLYTPGHPLNRDNFLTYLAVSAFIADFDGYRHAHNYRIYYHPDLRQWFFIPWGIDRALKQDLGIYDSYGRAAAMCFADRQCRIDYLKTLARVTAQFERLNFLAGVDVLQTVTRTAALADTQKPYSNRAVDKARRKLRQFIQSRPAAITAQLSCLADDGERDADGDGFGCSDCNDADPAVFPGAQELCDRIDNDCSGQVDDAPACPCPTISAGGATFHLCGFARSWDQAEAFCVAKGLHLARLDDAAQSRAVFAAATQLRRERWWIGLNDRTAEGAFTWTDGSSLAAPQWVRGEPDNGPCNQDCAALKEDGDGGWHDTHCAQPRPFICR